MIVSLGGELLSNGFCLDDAREWKVWLDSQIHGRILAGFGLATA